jgi:hypothetical protein
MPRRSVRRKRSRKPMKKRKSLRKRKMRKRKTKRRKSRKGKSRRRRRRRVTLKINERINMKKIQSGGNFKGIMRSMGLGDVSLASSGLMNTIKGGYQTYIGGNDFQSASPINQKLDGNITGGVVPDVPAQMEAAAGTLQ